MACVSSNACLKVSLDSVMRLPVTKPRVTLGAIICQQSIIES